MKPTIKYFRDHEEYYLDGKQVSQAEFEKRVPKKGFAKSIFAASPSCWPMPSLAASVHPKQIAEAREHAKKNGVPTEFDREGRPILTSQRHFNAYLKTRRMHHRQAV